MISVNLDEAEGVVILKPEGALSEEDFASIKKAVDPYIEKAGRLKGLMIVTESFPGWESLKAFCSHITFVKEHHKKISRIALVTDSIAGEIGQHLASHFVDAEIRKFSPKEFADAKRWVVATDHRVKKHLV